MEFWIAPKINLKLCVRTKRKRSWEKRDVWNTKHECIAQKAKSNYTRLDKVLCITNHLVRWVQIPCSIFWANHFNKDTNYGHFLPQTLRKFRSVLLHREEIVKASCLTKVMSKALEQSNLPNNSWFLNCLVNYLVIKQSMFSMTSIGSITMITQNVQNTILGHVFVK